LLQIGDTCEALSGNGLPSIFQHVKRDEWNEKGSLRTLEHDLIVVEGDRSLFDHEETGSRLSVDDNSQANALIDSRLGLILLITPGERRFDSSMSKLPGRYVGVTGVDATRPFGPRWSF
jgi:hypothetical protein